MKYAIWMDHGYDGWSPVYGETLERAFAEMHSQGHAGAYQVTKLIDVEFTEVSL